MKNEKLQPQTEAKILHSQGRRSHEWLPKELVRRKDVVSYNRCSTSVGGQLARRARDEGLLWGGKEENGTKMGKGGSQSYDQ